MMPFPLIRLGGPSRSYLSAQASKDGESPPDSVSAGRRRARAGWLRRPLRRRSTEAAETRRPAQPTSQAQGSDPFRTSKRLRSQPSQPARSRTILPTQPVPLKARRKRASARPSVSP